MSEHTANLKKVGSPFWRMYLFSVLQLVLAVLTIYLVIRAIQGPMPHEKIQTLSREALAGQFDQGIADLEGLDRVLAAIEGLGSRDTAIYDGRGTLLSSVGRHVPPPLAKDQAAGLVAVETFEIDGRSYTAAPVDAASGSYVIKKGTRLGGPPWWNLAIGLAAALVVLAMLTLPLAYKVTLPIQKIINTARRLASGDLTARSKMTSHGEIGRLGQTVDEMADRLQARISSEKELIANISHELRTPLARIRVAQEMCSEEGTTVEEMKESLDGIGEDVQELERLIDDVLKASKLDLAQTGTSGASIALRPEPTDLRDLMERSARRFASIHPEHSLQIDRPEQLPVLDADPSLVRRVLDNLLDNAAKYSDTTEPILIAASAGDDHVLLTVSDRGVGVDESELEKIFEAFYRAESARTRYVEGTGIGLALCKGIADAHGGSITATRREGGGLTIELILPLS